MAKKASRRKHQAGRETGAERAAKIERQMLERAVRQQKKIRALSKQLINATVGADVALRAVGRMALARETPEGRFELEPALAGSSATE